MFIFGSDQLLHFMGLEEALVDLGRGYLQVYGGSLFISSLTAVIIAVMRSHSFTETCFACTDVCQYPSCYW